MDLSYGEKYEAFRRQVRRFLEEHRDRAPRGLGVLADPGSGLESRRAWQEALISKGYTARTIPRRYGGFGAEPDPLETVILDEEFGAAHQPRGLSGQGIDMLVPTLLEHGSEEQKKRYIPPTLLGEMLWCQGYSEPGSGSDLASLQTSAVEDGDDFVINGQKIWTTTAQISQMMFCLVRTEPDVPKHGGISYILIPMDAPGIDVRPLRTMTGGAEFNEVFLTDVRVPKANIVGKRGEGWRIANTTLKHERNMLGNAGRIEGSLQLLIDLMKNEEIDGRPAIEHAVHLDRLMELQAWTMSLKYHSMRLLTHTIKGESSGLAGLVVKLGGCELSHQIAKLAIDVLGETGVLYRGSKYLRANGMWQFQYMFSLGLIIGGGTAQIQKNIISERGLGMPREPKPAG
jgi:alkylation response protein AidB-like acyl-CoA dehydrogenase